MIQSMTGYGNHTLTIDQKKLTIEIRTLNNKQTDLSIKLPPLYREKEVEIRALVTERLQRGKIDLNISLEKTAQTPTTLINTQIGKQYFDQVRAFANTCSPNISDSECFRTTMHLADIWETPTQELTEQEWQLLREAIAQTCDTVIDFRIHEGKILEADFRKRILLIESLLQQIEEIDQTRTPSIRERIEKHMAEYLPNATIDQNRFEQELIYYIEKLDITEEKVRLQKHCDFFTAMLNADESNGKKMSFIAQEIGREVNTIGSKANNADIQRIVVQMKDELEKIKEQLCNIL